MYIGIIANTYTCKNQCKNEVMCAFMNTQQLCFGGGFCSRMFKKRQITTSYQYNNQSREIFCVAWRLFAWHASRAAKRASMHVCSGRFLGIRLALSCTPTSLRSVAELRAHRDILHRPRATTSASPAPHTHTHTATSTRRHPPFAIAITEPSLI